MDSGLDKLVEAGESVTLLKAELAVKEAELIIANEKADKVILELKNLVQTNKILTVNGLFFSFSSNRY